MTDNIKKHLLMEAENEVNPSIKDKFFGEYHINVENIVEPEGDNTHFRVRDVDMDTVDKLCQNMIKSVDLPFNAAPMIVLAFEDTKHSLMQKRVSSCKFVVLDGNHRLRAIKQTKRITGEYVIRDVLCHVYTELSRDEALRLGVNNNSHNDHANAMTDWQKVNLLRSLLDQPHSQVTPVEVSTYDLRRFYTILGATTRKERRAVTPLTILAKLSSRCWNLVRAAFDSKKCKKASTFNCLSGLEEQICYEQLKDFVENKTTLATFSTACKATKLSNTKSKLISMEVSKDIIKVGSGRKTLLCTAMNIRLDNGNVYQGSAAEIYKMLERSELKLEEDQRNLPSEENGSNVPFVDETELVTESSNDDSTQEFNIRHGCAYKQGFSSREAGISEDVTLDNTPENITERARPTQHDSDQESLDNDSTQEFNIRHGCAYKQGFSSREAVISEDVTSDNTPENITERARPTQHDSDQESLDNDSTQEFNIRHGCAYKQGFSSREAVISEDVTSDNTPENITERARPTQHDSDHESLYNEDETDSIPATPPSSKKYTYRYAYNGLSEYRNRKRKENINEDHENKDDKITDIDRPEIGLKTYGKRRMYREESKQKDVLVSPSTIDDLESPVAKTVKSSSHIESSTKTSQDFTISTYPDDISAGDWILIKSPVDAEEKWIGEVTSVKRKINFYWVFNNNEVWVGGGVMRPKSGTCSKTDILAKFEYDFRHKMPTALKEKLDNLLSS